MAQQLKLSQRIAEESQLLAEERWIKEALTKIRNQRNCLQIERLHLESMKSQLKISAEGSRKESDAEDSSADAEPQQVTRRTRESLEFEEPIIDEGCNEELNLDVNNDALGLLRERGALDIEEEEDEDGDLDEEDLLIDMNMFMNGKPSKWDQ